MKLLSASQLRAADAYTIEHEPIASVDLMERASNAFVSAFLNVFPEASEVTVLCGTGNNGGDGLVIARLLHQAGWNVRCFLIAFSEKTSADNQINQERWTHLGEALPVVHEIQDLPALNTPFIVDALVGTGITRPLEGLLKDVVEHINGSSAHVCSVDLPSGLYDQGDCSNLVDGMVHADTTFTFEAVKRNFLLPEYGDVVGHWSVLDIGLNKSVLESQNSNELLVDHALASSLLRPRDPFAHKGTFGHAGIVAGSYGMLGAAVLATNACLRSGVGLTTVHVPECGYTVLQTTAPEAMCLVSGERFLTKAPPLTKYTAVGIGPGMEQHPESVTAVMQLLKADVPLILDADALNGISGKSEVHFPAGTILTPHPKEFERLFGTTQNSTERLALAREKAAHHNIFIVLKGRFTQIVCPDGSVYFNGSGNSGMATGGSGDVLTGIITGLRAQGYPSKEACVLGCFLHGAAGDLAAEDIGQHAMIASDIIVYLPEAFLHLTH